jgi:hypothetical protein
MLTRAVTSSSGNGPSVTAVTSHRIVSFLLSLVGCQARRRDLQDHFGPCMCLQDEVSADPARLTIHATSLRTCSSCNLVSSNSSIGLSAHLEAPDGSLTTGTPAPSDRPPTAPDSVGSCCSRARTHTVRKKDHLIRTDWAAPFG